MRKLLIIICSIFLFGLSPYDGRIKGHSIPFDEEYLPQTVELDCGVSITEWRGSVLNTEIINNLNTLCTFTKRNFFIFIKDKKFKINSEKKYLRFMWSFSFIPINTGYRDLNDTTWRFSDRKFKFVSGYTQTYDNYSWTISDKNDPLFQVTFSHELFHALSAYYRLYDNYPGKDIYEKLELDEKYAQEFTLKFLKQK